MNKQNGTILILFLGWLAILSVMGMGALRQSLSSSETTQAQHVALHTFEAAQAALWNAEQIISHWYHDPVGCHSICIVSAESNDFYARQPNGWWRSQNAVITSIPWLEAIQAYYVIEYLTTITDETETEQQFFRITAKALAVGQRGATTLQSTVAKSIENDENVPFQQKVPFKLTTIKGDAALVTGQAWRQIY